MDQNNTNSQTNTDKTENERELYDDERYSDDERENDDISMDSEAVPELDDEDSEEEGIYEYCEIMKGIWHRRLREHGEDPDELHRRIEAAKTTAERAEAFWNN